MNRLVFAALAAVGLIAVVDAGTDSGPIIVQEAVPVLEDDTPETLHVRIQLQEHLAFPEALNILVKGNYRIEGRRVRIAYDGE